MPATIEATLHSEAAVQEMAESFRDARSALFVGRGALFPVALEGALKLKETSYIHAEDGRRRASSTGRSPSSRKACRS